MSEKPPERRRKTLSVGGGKVIPFVTALSILAARKEGKEVASGVATRAAKKLDDILDWLHEISSTF